MSEGITQRRFEKLQAVLRQRQPDLTVLMEKVHKPHNVSAVLRSCEAVGILDVHAVVPQRKFFISPGISSGSDKWIRLHRHPTTEAALAELRAGGFRIVAAHPSDDALDFRDVDYTQPTAIVLGTELYGLSDDALAAVDTRINIPMMGFVQSLNVSVTAALILFEAQRQRSRAGLYETCRIPDDEFERILFEWAYPDVAAVLRERSEPYPALGPDGRLGLAV